MHSRKGMTMDPCIPIGRGRGGVLISCMAVIIGALTLASLPCRDGARRVFADKADIACTDLQN